MCYKNIITFIMLIIFGLSLCACAVNTSGAEEETTTIDEEALALEAEQKATELLNEGINSLYALNGEELNLENAFNKFSEAVEAGNAKANYYLGLMYDMYSYPKSDYSLAMDYYKKSTNDLYARLNVALLYLNGCGMDVNTERADSILNSLVEKGLKEANIGKGIIALHKEDYTSAIELFNKALDSEEQFYNGLTYYLLGSLYMNEEEKTFDEKKAFDCFKKSADLNFEQGICLLGDAYRDGIGVEKDIEKAKELYNKAVSYNFCEGYMSLGYLSYSGIGEDKDEKKAFDAFIKLENRNYPAAQMWIGYMYGYEEGVEQDYEKALEYFEKSAIAGNAFSSLETGLFYAKGYGTNQNDLTALKYFDKADKLGEEGAKEWIDHIMKKLGIEEK